jgi:hypothetical protein
MEFFVGNPFTASLQVNKVAHLEFPEERAELPAIGDPPWSWPLRVVEGAMGAVRIWVCQLQVSRWGVANSRPVDGAWPTPSQ